MENRRQLPAPIGPRLATVWQQDHRKKAGAHNCARALRKAQARQELLKLASVKLGAPVEKLNVTDGGRQRFGRELSRRTSKT